MLKLRRCVVWVVAVLLMSGAALAETFTPTELAELRVDANAGDVRAQYLLGLRYALGEGVPQDDAEAVSWYRQAAEQGDAAAQFILGLYYRNGTGVPQDYFEAVALFRQAAEQGHASAQHSLGDTTPPHAELPPRFWRNPDEMRS